MNSLSSFRENISLSLATFFPCLNCNPDSVELGFFFALA